MDLKVVEKIKGAFDEVKQKLVVELNNQKQELKAVQNTTDSTAKKLRDLEAQYEQIVADLKGAIEELEKKNQRLSAGDYDVKQPIKSPGTTFVESKEYQEFKADNFRGNSRRVEIPSTFKMYRREVKDLTGGQFLRNVLSVERVEEIFSNPVRTMHIRDLFPVFPTENSSIEYVRETLTSTVNTSAQPQSEGTLKAEALLDFEDKSVTVRTIAHWIPVNNQLLSDVKALGPFIDKRLIEGLLLREDVQLLYGSGADPDLTGILNDPDIQNYLWSNGAVGDTQLDAIRRSITLARLAEYPVTAVVINPQDWEKIELLKGTDSHYLWVTVPDGGQPMVWRVPVIDTTAINPGDCLVGAFDQGAAIWDREQASIRVTDSHADYFIRNKSVILAEERLALTIYRPQSFVHCQFDAAPVS